MRAVVVSEPGDPDVLTVAEVPEPVPGPGELLVAVGAAGVNRADLLQRAGHYAPPAGAPAWPGLEVAGEVLAVGPGTTAAEPSAGSPWQVGDRVAALLPGGGYAERVVVPVELALRVPDGLSTLEAASLPEALATVLSNLRVAHAVAGETVLVRGGSGGVGSVAVPLARALGLRVLATAGGPDRVERVRALGAHAVLDHRSDDLVARVLAETDGRGVDVVLDVLGAGALADNLAMLADDGRLVVIGLQRGRRAELDLGLLMAKRATVVGTMLRSRPAAQKAAIMADVRAHAWPLVAEGTVRPVVHATYSFAEAASAHRELESGAVLGKVLLVP
ncbi:NAD(P)H-quinone oxidoreductase [Cellulomonas soli]|uniref:NAD(P)H-quinone oxidoreductase n=1 Tax=Cellulomonas soli TaxID=931535 RepID=UPI0011BDFE30|nr:NAD(P)H-quinone oxidoreductase [Cellulomonas soli]NYI58467.1 putative PIG3 family NAD(P)H quinone oxidoreductase [Cellulomonas soli]